MPLISELITKLKADTSDFMKGIKQSEKSTINFSKKIAKLGAGIAAAVGVAAVGAFVGLLNSINNTADEIDALAKRAHKFGSDVAAFQRLEYVASLAGVEVSTLEQGMGRLVKSMSDAKRGVGEAKDAFKELGLSVQQLDKMSIDKQYMAISKAIQQVSDKNKQAQLAVQIFGRSGVEQLNLLRENITGLSKEFDTFGGALTNKQAKAVESYNDSVTRLGAIFNTFRIQLTAQVAPALEMIVKWIGDTILKMGGLGPVANKAAQFMVSGLLLIVKTTQSVINGINNIIDMFKKAHLVLLNFAQSFNELNFEVFGGDFNFERAEKIAKLQRDLKASSTSGELTAPLQQGLRNVQGTLQQQQKTQVEVKITTEKGLKAEVAESPEITRKINQMLGIGLSGAAAKVGR